MANKKKLIIRARGGHFYPDDSIPNLISELETALDNGYTHVEADYSGDDKDYVYISEREETDEEYENRISGERKRAEQLKAAELEELARLKKKYES